MHCLPLTLFGSLQTITDIADIYSFAVNTINIVLVTSTRENLNVFITRDENCYGIH